MCMRGFGVEGAIKHPGKVWQTYASAINIAQEKFEPEPSQEKMRKLLEGLSNMACAANASNGFEAF